MDPSKVPNRGKMLHLQSQVRNNAAEISDYFHDLVSWEDEVKAKDRAIIKGDLNPVRGKKTVAPVRQRGFAEMVPSGMPGPKDKDRAKGGDQGSEEDRIRPKNYQDYNQWDKFVHKDLDKMLHEFDENDRQEQEEGHRNKLAEERRKIEEKERIARAHVDEAERLKGLGNDLLKAGDLEGALAMYGRAIDTDSKNPVPFANRALVLLKLGRPAEAVADCDACLLLDPRYVKALLRRASARVGLGEREAAVMDLKKVVMIEPGNKEAKSELAELMKPPLTEEELAAQEKERQEAAAKEEKERRRRERGGKKLMVREADELPQRSAADADMTTRRAHNAPSSAPSSAPSPAGASPEAATAGGKVFINLQDAKEIAKSAKEAVEKALSGESLPVPGNSIEFERAWKRVKNDVARREAFLDSIPPNKMGSYFKSDLDDDVLTAIIAVVTKRWLPSRVGDVVILLKGLQQVPRFGISIKLMGKADKAALEQVLQGIEEGLGDADEGLCAEYRMMLAK